MNFILKLYDIVSNFFNKLQMHLNFGLLFSISFGLLLLTFIVSLIKTNFTYELKLLRTINKLNRYFMKEPYVNEENLIRFNNKMKKVPKQLRYTWQEFMLNRDKAPSEYMNSTTCIDQPSKASSYSNTANSVSTFTTIISVLTFFFSIVIGLKDEINQNQFDISSIFFSYFLIPVLIFTLGQLFVIFLRARYTSINADLYYVFHEFERNINKACTTLPQFIDYEVLFTRREIREGIPVLQEYLEKRALQEKIEQEEAQLNALEYEQFDFAEIGIENSLLLDRAMLESEKFFKVKTDLTQKIKAKELEMQNYQKGFDEVTKDYERKAQVLRETLQQLTEQINNTTIKIEANYMKKRYNEEQQRLQQLEKEYELSTNRFQKQQAELEAEINSYKEEIQRRKQMLQDAMMAEGRTYAKKVYSIITADVQEQSRPYLEQMELIRIELEQAVNTLKNELQYKNNELAQLNAKLEKTNQEYQIKLAGLENVKELKDYLTSAEYRQKLLRATSDEDKEPAKLIDKVNKLTKEIEEKEDKLKQLTSAKQELEKRVKELTSANANLTKQVEKLSKKAKRKAKDEDDDDDVKEIKVFEEKEEDNKETQKETQTEKETNNEEEKENKEQIAEQEEQEEKEEKQNKTKEKNKGFFAKLFNKKEKEDKQEEKTEEIESKKSESNKPESTESEKPENEELQEKEEVSEVQNATVTPIDINLLKDEENDGDDQLVKAEKEEPLITEEKPQEEKEEVKEEVKEENQIQETKPEEQEEKQEVVEPVEVKEEVKQEVLTPRPQRTPKENIELKDKSESEKQEEKKVEKIIARKPKLDLSEIEELNAIKRRIEEESKNLLRNRVEEKVEEEKTETLSKLEKEDNKVSKQTKKQEEKQTLTENKKPETANKIGSSLNSLLKSVEKIEQKKKK